VRAKAIVGPADEIDARLFTGAAPNPVYTIYDYNKSKAVDANDLLAARGNSGALRFIKVAPANFAPTAEPALAPATTSVTPSAAPAAGSSSTNSAVTSALATAAASSLSSPTATQSWLAGVPSSVNLHSVNLNGGAPAQIFEALARANTSASRALLSDIAHAANAQGLDDPLLDSLLADLGLQ
jgi:hypothetical protein